MAKHCGWQPLGFRVQGAGFRVEGLGFEGSGSGVLGLGSRACRFRVLGCVVSRKKRGSRTQST